MDSKKFRYTYSAPTEDERREISSIRRQYLAKNEEETKFEKLKRLDAKVKNWPTTIALILGIVGILVFGLGLTMVLEWSIVVWGIVLAIVGAIPIALAHPVYIKRLQINKEKYGEEILKLSEELLNEEKQN